MTHYKGIVLSVAVLTLSLVLAAPAQGATIYQFQSGVWNGNVADTGYTTNDAHVQPSTGSTNYNLAYIRVKYMGPDPVFGILGFDIAAASGITVASASLTLTVQYDGGANLISQGLYNLPVGNTSWSETTATSDYQNGTIGTTKWKNAAGADSSQLQYAASELLDSFSNVDVTIGQTVTFNIAASVAQAWVDNPASFTGLVIKQPGGNDQFYYYSGEASASSYRPLLTITAVPEPSSLALLGVGVVVLLTARRRRI